MALPFFTIIIPLRKQLSYLLPLTWDSLASQQGSVSFEVIVVDGIGASLPPLENMRRLEAKSENVFAMINQALAVAKGEYIHVLGSGEFYLSNKALAFAMKILHAYDFPDLLYTARMVRHHFGAPTVDLHPITDRDLKGGKIPTTLKPFWWKREPLLMLGGLSEKYEIQGGYELICRYFRKTTLRKSFVHRLLVDYEYRKPPPGWILRECFETFWISLSQFGPTIHLFSWIVQNCLRLSRFSWKIARIAFWKRHVAY